MKATNILLCFGLCATMGWLASCSDDDFANGTEHDGDKGASVSFTVSDLQDDAPQSAAAPVAQLAKAYKGEISQASFANSLAMQGLTVEDLTTQKLPVEGGDGSACLIETTVPGSNPVKRSPITRADITTAITENFTTIGYRGTSAAGISTTPWFYNKATRPDGSLIDDIRWSWDLRFGKFYAVSPMVTGSYSKIALSDAGYASTPYVDFEAETDVKKQKDLMTACSGVVEYATRYVAPTSKLAFRHALTAVRFKVGQNLSWAKTITKVEIVGAMSKGRYTLPTDENGTDAGWSDLSAPATFTLDGVNVSTSRAVNQVIMGNTGDNYTFYMLPQPLAGVKVKIYFSDNTSINTNLSGTWKAGTTKTYALSENKSTWQYTLTVTNPAAVDYTSSTTSSYHITSYRKAPDGTLQPVSWKVVGFDGNGDGVFSMDEKPSWLTSLSKTEGYGGGAAETGTATLATDITDLLAARNKALKSATPLGSAGSPYDLSTKGGSVARSTANCYVISAPGHYSIPLVYGNAITGGVANDPWITLTNGGANTPDAAKIVWADEKGLVTNLSVKGSGRNAFVEFEVPASAIKNGNAVIAVTKGSTVVWSWHLWFAPQDVLNTTPVTNFQNKVYHFTNETLGFKYTAWSGSSYSAPRSVKVKVEQTVGQAVGKQVGYITITQNNGNVRQGYSTLYQFGRKDAFPGTDSTPDGSFNKDGGDNMSIPNGIQHPETFYTSGKSWTDNPPSGYSYYNLWSMDNTTTDYNDNVVIKTIYDPCPAGFKMPANNAFTGFTTNGENGDKNNVSGAWENGWNFNNKISSPDATVYFPATGYRTRSYGNLSSMGGTGYYWSAGPHNTGLGCRMNFSKFNVFPKNSDFRSMGFSVRPVAIEHP